MSIRDTNPDTLPRINAEVIRSREKYPGNARMIEAVRGEVNELADALATGDYDAWYSEAAQVAAVAARIMEEGDRDLAVPPER